MERSAATVEPLVEVLLAVLLEQPLSEASSGSSASGRRAVTVPSQGDGPVSTPAQRTAVLLRQLRIKITGRP